MFHFAYYIVDQQTNWVRLSSSNISLCLCYVMYRTLTKVYKLVNGRMKGTGAIQQLRRLARGKHGNLASGQSWHLSHFPSQFLNLCLPSLTLRKW